MTRTIRPNALTTWMLTLCAAGALSAPAHAFVLCAHNASTGDPSEGASVKIRSACKDSETTLDPSVLGVSPSGISTIVRTGDQITTNGGLSTPASCQPGEVATGGGVLTVGNAGGIPAMKASRPEPDTAGATPTGWRVTVANIADTGTITATAYVVCAGPAS